MNSAIIYKIDIGKIVGHAAGSLMPDHLMPGLAYLPHDAQVPGQLYYILDGQPTERPSSPVTLSDLTLMDVPAGSTLWINGERYENVEGDIELEFPLPGTYRLRVECWPYRDWEGEVTA